MASYADRLRQKQIERAQKSLEKTGDFFTPPIGTTKIRILPPVGDDFFYSSDSYHWVPDSLEGEESKKGKTVYVKRKLNKDGKQVEDPIDKKVSELYDKGRKLDNKKLQNLGGTLKRKRHYHIPVILVDETDPEKRYVILRDNSNEGKLIRLICSKMGFPFYKDIDDDWVDKDTVAIDPDKKYFDLVDPDEGHDFKIIKKSTGKDAWAYTYEESFVIETPRKLTKEEREMIGKLDIKNCVEYEEDYDTVKGYLDTLFGNFDEDDYEDEEVVEEEVEEKKEAKKQEKKSESKPKPKNVEVDEDDADALLAQLDDDDDED